MPDIAPDYDSATLNIDPAALDTAAQKLIEHAGNIVGSLNRISSSFAELQFQWAGDTAEQVQALNSWWDSVMRDLFGTEENPDQGVLNVMAAGVKAAAVGFSQTEVEIQQMFVKFAEGLAAAGQEPTPDTISDAGDPLYSPVHEDFPNV
ncbi:WXG100 family type VII secretion target [Streptomyces sp. NPDC001380]|uniref:WXG100 family type VII secretion target n=1 Tax=Streptomyces sp. NPDC001380 TaxID=3364566 RepID=UPI0036B54E14